MSRCENLSGREGGLARARLERAGFVSTETGDCRLATADWRLPTGDCRLFHSGPSSAGTFSPLEGDLMMGGERSRCA
jgi:hypothetical protein